VIIYFHKSIQEDKMKRQAVFLFGLIFLTFLALPAGATLIGGPDIIAAPPSVADDSPGAENTAQQAFDEAQNVFLNVALAVDGGSIGPGITVNSHMIFYNTVGTGTTTSRATWLFDGPILGVMSDSGGNLEAASNSLLGALGTTYPGAFSARGLEGQDFYNVVGNSIDVNMVVSEPGDWIRVVTRVPEPGSLLLLGIGLIGIAGVARKRFQK
jgi:hypothetical protein